MLYNQPQTEVHVVMSVHFLLGIGSTCMYEYSDAHAHDIKMCPENGHRTSCFNQFNLMFYANIRSQN